MKTSHTSLRPLMLALGIAGICTYNALADFPTALKALEPVGYWRFNEMATVPTVDPYSATNSGSAGAVANGAYIGMPARGLAGAIVGDSDTAMRVSGLSMLAPFSAAANPNGSFTVECWANPDNINSGNHTLLASMINGENGGNANDRSGWLLRHAADSLEFLLGGTDGNPFYVVTLSVPSVIQAGVWQHIVATYDASSTTLTLYLNGTNLTSVTSALYPNFTAPLRIGDRGYGGWGYNGLLDEIAVYPTALSQAEVLAHYNNGINPSRPQTYPSLVLTKNPVLYYRLDEPGVQLPVAANAGSWGTGGNGTYYPGSTAGLPGAQSPQFYGFESTNLAAYFNGTNGIVRVPAQTMNTDTATFLCWLKRDGNQPARAGIFHNRGSTTTATGLGFMDSGNALSYNWNDHGENYNFNPGFVPPDQAWTFFAVAVAPDQTVMYMGTAAGLVAATNTFANDAHDFSQATIDIGWDNYQATRVFKGSLDELAIFDKTLTYQQVSDLFSSALPAITFAARTPADPVYEGMTVTFSIAVAGPAPTIEWRKDGTVISGKTATTLTLNNVVTNDTGSYEVVVTSAGKTLAKAFSLTVLSSPPVIMQQPLSGTRFGGGAAVFSVSALGSVPLTYQWFYNGSPVGGATGSSLSLANLTAANAGNYSVRLTNPYGVTNSDTAVLTVLTATNIAAPVMAYGPVAYWSLNETSGTNALDLAGGFDAGYFGFPTNGVAGPRPPAFAGFSVENNAYEFNGSSAYLEAPASLDVNLNAFSISAWIKVNAWDKTWQAIVTKGDSSWRLHRNGMSDGSNTDAIGFGTTDLNNVDLAGTKSVNDANWHQVVAVYDGKAKYIYVDGALDGSVAAGGTVAANNYPVRIGENAQATGRQFNGSIDEVALFSRALSAAEVQELYQRAQGVAATTPKVSLQPVSESVIVGQPVVFTAAATGGAPYTYQWQRNGADITGAVNPAFSIPAADYADAGSYTVVIHNSAGNVTSQPAVLNVLTPPLFANSTNGLVLHLKFDGDPLDSSGHANDAMLLNSPTYVPGHIGSQAIHVNTEGSSTFNYVALQPSATLTFAETDSFSVSYWVKFTGTPDDLPMIGNALNSTYRDGWVFADNGGNPIWTLKSPSDQNPIPADSIRTVINDGVWHNIVGVFNRAATNAHTFVDGVLIDSRGIGGVGTLDTGNGIFIGQDPSGAYAVNGAFDIDDVGIWRRALTDYEAAGIYAAGQQGNSFDKYGPVQLAIAPVSNGLVLVWQAGTLWSTDSLVGGTWSEVQSAASPFTVTPSGAQKYYRIKL